MTNSEFSDGFDTLLNSHSASSFFGEQSARQDIVLDEYEKSVFLTQAQEEMVMSLYSGKNVYGESFESTEELREYLKPLIESAYKDYTEKNEDRDKTIKYGNYNRYRVSKIPNVIGIIYEEVTFDDNSLGCKDKTTVPVIPVRHDELVHILKNPFRGPNDRRVLRVDNQDDGVKMELITKYKLLQSSYYVRYIRRPKPIILVDLDGEVTIDGRTVQGDYQGSACELPAQLHHRILERAVQLALQSKGYNLQRENRDN